jgi:hypothetical protein
MMLHLPPAPAALAQEETVAGSSSSNETVGGEEWDLDALLRGAGVSRNIPSMYLPHQQLISHTATGTRGVLLLIAVRGRAGGDCGATSDSRQAGAWTTSGQDAEGA